MDKTSSKIWSSEWIASPWTKEQPWTSGSATAPPQISHNNVLKKT